MKFYTKESIKKLQDAVKIEVVISEVLNESHLKDKDLFIFKCPFCLKENSLIVDKTVKLYHCNKCKSHGDTVVFLMGYKKMSFNDAVERLAMQFNVDLEECSRPKKRNHSEIDKAFGNAVRTAQEIKDEDVRFYVITTIIELYEIAQKSKKKTTEELKDLAKVKELLGEN